ncbi:MAG: undecaprenyl/decaprenyl-phosphate alpha-N-acetylglucosaminyl 1-phosphate transferase [Deltaproteobacteria bacterium]|nr:undecaprenyl/decaprenyl-phosphate alpha-N-acetylglucosaminyl 1-phosphate transferase [Deltaproteobacteria bacterium]
MNKIAMMYHTAFFISLIGASAIICRFLIRRFTIIDIPNARSSHSGPIPKGGGIAIVAAFIMGILAALLVADSSLTAQWYFGGFVFSALLVAAVSLYDDIVATSFVFRLAVHTCAASTVIFFGLVIDEFRFPLLGEVHLGYSKYAVTLLWIVGLTNAFNFMDGINGMAAGSAILAGLFFGIISFLEGSHLSYIISYSIVAGCIGFIVFNFPRARLFMGDVGSTFLGFVFASLAIIAALYDYSHTSLLVVPLLLFHFIFDAFFTFLRRLIKGEDVFQAHRSHLYQLLTRMGCSQTGVSLFYFSMGLCQGVGAIYMIRVPGDKRVLVFIPFLIFQICYSIVVTVKSKRIGLI